MRKLLRRGHALRTVGAVVAVSALVGAGVALASSQFKQTAKIALTATKAGTSTGFKAHIASEDPGGPNGQAAGAEDPDGDVPEETKFNFKSKAIKQCKATPAELVGTKGAVCPVEEQDRHGHRDYQRRADLPEDPRERDSVRGEGDLLFLLVPTTAVGETLPAGRKGACQQADHDRAVPREERADVRDHRTEPERQNARLGQAGVRDGRSVQEAEIHGEIGLRLLHGLAGLTVELLQVQMRAKCKSRAFS